MNAAEIYKQATGRISSDEQLEAEKNRIAELDRQQQEELSWRQWHNNPITREFFASLESEIGKLDSDARELALNYFNHKNTEQILTVLIKSATLRKMIENAKAKTTTIGS